MSRRLLCLVASSILLNWSASQGKELDDDERAAKAELSDCAYSVALESIGYIFSPRSVHEVILIDCANKISSYNNVANRLPVSIDSSAPAPPKRDFAAAVIDRVMKQYFEAYRLIRER
jgi:hypothetical protein